MPSTFYMRIIMPIILYLIIIIVFVAKAISKSSSHGTRRSSAQGSNYAGGRFTQSQRAAGSAPLRKSQPRQSQSRMAHRTADNPTAAYSYKRSGFSYSSLKPNEDGLEVLMRRNRERERELEKRIQ